MFNLKIQRFPAQLRATFLGKAVFFGFIYPRQCCWILLPTPRSVWSSDAVRWNFWKWMADRNNGFPYDRYIPIYIYMFSRWNDSSSQIRHVLRRFTRTLGNLQSFNRCFQMFPKCSILAPGAIRKKRMLWLAKNGSLLQVTQTGSQHPTKTAGCLVDDGTTGRCDMI